MCHTECRGPPQPTLERVRESVPFKHVVERNSGTLKNDFKIFTENLFTVSRKVIEIENF